jgi:hypothetical protein
MNTSLHLVNLYYDEISDEVAVIDEIQLMRDPGRGWAWTRALLGVMAEEIHVCGEYAALDLLSGLALTCDEEVTVSLNLSFSKLWKNY